MAHTQHETTPSNPSKYEPVELAPLSPFDVNNQDVIPPSRQNLQALRELGEGEEFDDALDELATEFLSTNVEEFTANAREMRAKPSKARQKEIKATQLELLSRARQYIVEKAGLAVDSRTPLERAREHVASTRERLPVADRDNREKLYEALGLKHVDTNLGVYWYSSVGSLLPDGSYEYYKNYQRSRNHLEKTSKEFGEGHASKQDVQDADWAQRNAHNRLADIVVDVFGDVGLSHDDARELITRRYAGILHLEGPEYQHIRDHDRAALEMGKTVVDAMHEHLLPEYKDLPDPESYHFRPR